MGVVPGKVQHSFLINRGAPIPLIDPKTSTDHRKEGCEREPTNEICKKRLEM